MKKETLTKAFVLIATVVTMTACGNSTASGSDLLPSESVVAEAVVMETAAPKVTATPEKDDSTDVKDGSKDTKDTKDIKDDDSKDIKDDDSKDTKDTKDTKEDDSKDTKDVKDTKDTKNDEESWDLTIDVDNYDGEIIESSGYKIPKVLYEKTYKWEEYSGNYKDYDTYHMHAPGAAYLDAVLAKGELETESNDFRLVDYEGHKVVAPHIGEVDKKAINNSSESFWELVINGTLYGDDTSNSNYIRWETDYTWPVLTYDIYGNSIDYGDDVLFSIENGKFRYNCGVGEIYYLPQHNIADYRTVYMEYIEPNIPSEYDQVNSLLITSEEVWNATYYYISYDSKYQDLAIECESAYENEDGSVTFDLDYVPGYEGHKVSYEEFCEIYYSFVEKYGKTFVRLNATIAGEECFTNSDTGMYGYHEWDTHGNPDDRCFTREEHMAKCGLTEPRF